MTENEFVQRLERLERAHRRLKGLVLAVLVLATVLGTIYATLPIPQIVSAHEVDVLDDLGKVRVRMNVASGKGPGISVYDAQGNADLAMFVNPEGVPAITLSGPGQQFALQLLVGSGNRPTITLNRVASGIFQAGLVLDLEPSGAPDIRLFEGKGHADMGVDPSGKPWLTLADPQGFRMDLGDTQTVIPTTGETQQTSAASIVMFGDDEKHHVIWTAP